MVVMRSLVMRLEAGFAIDQHISGLAQALADDELASAAIGPAEQRIHPPIPNFSRKSSVSNARLMNTIP
jgi:hypothetical protein